MRDLNGIPYKGSTYASFLKVGSPGHGGRKRGFKHVAHLRRAAKKQTTKRRRQKFRRWEEP